MNITLDQIIQQGGPVGFALLFAWLWMRSEAKSKELEGRIDALQEEVKDIYRGQIELLSRYSDGGV